MDVGEATRNLGSVALRAGEPEEALVRLQEAATIASELDTDTLVAEVQVPLSEALLAVGRPVEAWEVASTALTVLAGQERHGTLVLAAHRVRADALLSTGSAERGRLELEAAASAARRVGDGTQEQAIEERLAGLTLGVRSS